MRRRVPVNLRTVVVIFALAALPAAAAPSCSASQASSSGTPVPSLGGTGGGAGITASGGGAGESGAPGVGPGGQGPGGMTGAGGSSGSASGDPAGGGQGGGGFEKAVWAPFPLDVTECSDLVYLTNAPAVAPAFSWSSCDTSVTGCKQLKWSADFALQNPYVVGSIGHDDGQSKWLVALVSNVSFVPFGAATSYVVVADLESGKMVHAWRTHADFCGRSFAAIENGHFAVPFGATSSATLVSWGLVVGSLAAGSTPKATATKQVKPWEVPAARAVGTSATAAVWGVGATLTLYDRDSGEAIGDLATGQQSKGELGRPVAFGDEFLFDVYSAPLRRVDARLYPNAVHTLLAEPSSDPFMARFTGSHVAWLRGFGPKGDGVTYDKLELWAAAVTTPLLASPQFVAAWPFTSGVQDAVGAFDTYASTSWLETADNRSVHLWHIPDGAHRSVQVPSAFNVTRVIAMMRDEVVVTISKAGVPVPHAIERFPVESLPVVP